MFLILIFVMVIVPFKSIIGVDDNDSDYYEEYDDFMDIYNQSTNYRGEKFVEEYLTVDGIKPTSADLVIYVENLMKTVEYFADKPNDTDPNVSIGLFFTKAILKRTLLDYGDKLADLIKHNIKQIIKKAEFVLSHFIYDCKHYEDDDLLYKLSKLFMHDDAVVYSIGKFNKNILKKWINSNLRLHDYIEEMDDMTLCRFEYVKLVITMDDFYAVNDSDFCIASLSAHPLPIKIDEMESCQWDEYCIERVFKMPSFAYILSHRLVYLLGLHLARRCYVVSEAIDMQHMDIMCANMYREAVYLARRGFFYRDLFMEHIALCGLLGYEEFFRHKWFKKTLTWIDEDGCMMENKNFEINRTALYMARATTNKMRRDVRRLKRKLMIDNCQHHQMALLMMVLGHAIRYTAHYMGIA